MAWLGSEFNKNGLTLSPEKTQVHVLLPISRTAIVFQTRTRLITDLVEGESPSRCRSASISARISTAHSNCCPDMGANLGGAISRTKVCRG